MGRPCVCGASALDIDLRAKKVRVGDTVLREGDPIAIDGTAGIVTADDVELVEPALSEQLQTVLEWSDEMRRLGIRTNADTPEDARKAREFGAEGIGLCRTEHMFMEGDRQPKMRAMIMAETEEDRRAALDELLPLQQYDFEGLFEVMAGLPVTIRLLDPPLHEFLPSGRRWPRAWSAPATRIPTWSPSSSRARPSPLPGRDQPDARHPRLPPRAAASRDLRDAGARDRAGRARVRGDVAQARDHDPAGGLREGARADARAGRAGDRRGGGRPA